MQVNIDKEDLKSLLRDYEPPSFNKGEPYEWEIFGKLWGGAHSPDEWAWDKSQLDLLDEETLWRMYTYLKATCNNRWWK